ncbi:hypothetical protein ACRAWF_15635 [Streptomyces sp. L7]
MSDIHHPGRRSVLTAGLASAAALGGSWLLTGCAGAEAAPVLPAAAAKGAPDRGGTLRIARPPASDAETLDPASSPVRVRIPGRSLQPARPRRRERRAGPRPRRVLGTRRQGPHLDLPPP